MSDPATTAGRDNRMCSANRYERIAASATAMTPNAGSSASEIRRARLAKNGPCTGTSAMKATSPAAKPAKLHGKASRTATMDGASAMLLQLANHGLDAADDSDIAGVDWLHRRILRL